MSDYLWDRSGPPDPEIEKLERALAPLRYQGAARAPRRRWWPVAVAAGIVLAAAGIWRLAAPASETTSWQIANVQGSARIGRRAAVLNSPVRIGQVLETGPGSQITLRDNRTGALDLGPSSTMSASDARHLRLSRGQLHAYI
jgi:hypothetical protein